MKNLKKVIFVGKRATCREPMAMALLQREDLRNSVDVEAKGLVVLFPEPMNPKAEEVLAGYGIAMPGYRANPLTPEDFSEDTLILTFHRDLIEKVMEMEGAQNVYVLTEVTGDELEIIDPYGGDMIQYEICMETLNNTIHKLAECLNTMEAQCTPGWEQAD
ncbi:MAG: phosphotyrosine protein phosphatase [Clostridiales bacterium]|nr:phosphotyrosine protein phosphatase [Clostridiales bacterium]